MTDDDYADTPTCGTCRFYEGADDAGTCHRYAPRPWVANPDEAWGRVDVTWPRVLVDDWCGEFKANPEA